jgi:hypothetical protein
VFQCIRAHIFKIFPVISAALCRLVAHSVWLSLLCYRKLASGLQEMLLPWKRARTAAAVKVSGRTSNPAFRGRLLPSLQAVDDSLSCLVKNAG